MSALINPNNANSSSHSSYSNLGASTPQSIANSYPLGVPITSYRLLNIVLLLGLGIPKAISSAKGDSAIAGDFDWAGGLIAALLYAFTHYLKHASKLIPLLLIQLVIPWVG